MGIPNNQSIMRSSTKINEKTVASTSQTMKYKGGPAGAGKQLGENEMGRSRKVDSMVNEINFKTDLSGFKVLASRSWQIMSINLFNVSHPAVGKGSWWSVIN